MDVGMTGAGMKTRNFNESDLLFEIKDRAREGIEGWAENHKLAEQDVRFAMKGQQWPAEVELERNDAENPRPMLTINQLPKFVRQVLGDGKQNRLQINVSAIEGDRSRKIRNMAGTQDYTYAQVMEGLVRNIEYTSKAERAYDKALEHCVDGGFGWLRVIKRYARPDGFEQELAIRGVRNRWCVLIDPSAMVSDEPDMADAQYGLVHTFVNKRDARKRWGRDVIDANTVESDQQVVASQWWVEGANLRLVEYYWVEESPERYYLLSDGRILNSADYEAAKDALNKAKIVTMNDRRGIKREVYWCLADAFKVIEGPYKWDGGYLPLVPVLGPEVLLDGKPEYQGLFRHSHDAQRLYNYWRTAATEAVALAPKAPWLADVQSIAGYEEDYKGSQTSHKTLLRYRFREGVPPPQRVQAAQNPAAEISQALAANDDVKSTLGLFDASIGARSNETSGKAIEARQAEGDVGTFAWHDALAKGVEQIGRILVDIAPKIYDTPRQVRLRMPDESEDWVMLNTEVLGPDGKPVMGPDGDRVIHDLGAQRYDVAIKAGPSFTTQRKQAAASMVEFARAVPNAAALIGDEVAQAMDWPNADRIAKRLKKSLPPGILTPAEEEDLNDGQDPKPLPPTPEQELQAKELDVKTRELDVRELEAKAKMAQAQALKPQNVKELVAEALAEVLSAGAKASVPGNGATAGPG